MRKKFLSFGSLLMAVGLFASACQSIFPQTSAFNSSSSQHGSAFDSEQSAINSNSAQKDDKISYIDISYGEHYLQTMDIHIPKGPQDARYPVVVTLHGGEWWSGDKKATERYTKTILNFNCIHVNMNYHLLTNDFLNDDSNTKKPYEVMLTDVELVFNFLVQNAEKYHIDTTKAGIAGYSSGGHLSLLYAYTKTDAPIPIDFVISETGPTNFLDPKTFTEDGGMWLHEGHDGHEDIAIYPSMSKSYRLDLIGTLTGVEYGELGWEEAWRKASPVYAVTPTSPKTYLFYGSHDAIVPMSHAELLKSKHPNCVLYEIVNTAHELYENPVELQNFHARLSKILEEF